MRFDAVLRLAEQVNDAGKTLGEGRREATGGAQAFKYEPVPNPVFGAFGNTANATNAESAYAKLRYSADHLAEILIDVLGTDGSRLRTAVKLFKELDDRIADQLLAAEKGGFDVYSAHVHSDGLGKYDDHVRTQQIDKLHGALNRGPSLLGADLNVVTNDGDNPGQTTSGDAVHGIKQDGYTVYSGGVGQNGQLTGTSPTHQRIDHVAGSPGFIMNNRPHVIDGGTSDHDGMVIDVEIPNW